MNQELKSTLAVLSDINRVEGFEPKTLTTAYSSDDGVEMYLRFAPQVLWFRARYPHGEIRENEFHVDRISVPGKGVIGEAQCRMQVWDEDGHCIGSGASVCREDSLTAHHFSGDYVRAAYVNALRMALFTAGFSTPLDADVIEGVTTVIPSGSGQSECYDRIRPQSTREKITPRSPVLPPDPLPENLSSPKPADPLEEALDTVLNSGRYKGLSFRQLIERHQENEILRVLRFCKDPDSPEYKAALLLKGQFCC